MDLFRLIEQPALTRSTLIVGWEEDAGGLGRAVTDYLKARLPFRELGEIAPVDFFPLNGVSVEDNIARFPESKFYYYPEKEVVLFQSSTPRLEWYRFLNTLLDIAVNYCHTQEFYTLGGMVTLSPHTVPREAITVVNQPELKPALSAAGAHTDMNYETPPGERPTLNSFLLWLAQQRGMPGVNLWMPVPFYLIPVGDPEAYRQTLGFFDKRLNLQLDLAELETAATEQSKKIADARMEFPEMDGYLRRLENNVQLTEEENEKLMQEILQILGGQ